MNAIDQHNDFGGNKKRKEKKRRCQNIYACVNTGGIDEPGM